MEGGGPFPFLSLSPSPRGTDKEEGEGGRQESCSPEILGDTSWEGSQPPLIKQAKRTRGKAVFKTPSTF